MTQCAHATMRGRQCLHPAGYGPGGTLCHMHAMPRSGKRGGGNNPGSPWRKEPACDTPRAKLSYINMKRRRTSDEGRHSR